VFLDNKYTLWYHHIVSKAKSLGRSKKDAYLEEHHIVPRSLGGDNSKANRVLLTGREHFICHVLLTKMVSGSDYHKMLHAIMLMKGANKLQQRYVSSTMYERLKKEYASYMSQRRSSVALEKEQKASIANSMRLYHRSKSVEDRATTGAKISVKAKQRKRKPWPPEYRAAMSDIMKTRHRYAKD